MKKILVSVLLCNIISACHVGSSSGNVDANIGNGYALQLTRGVELSNFLNQKTNKGHEVSELATATVGLKISYKNGQTGICTGTVISKNKILTAAHCFAEKTVNKIYNNGPISVVTYDGSDGGSLISLQPESVKFSYDDTKYIPGSDIAVLNFKYNFNHYLSEDKILANNKPGDIALASQRIKDLMVALYTTRSNLFRFSWGGGGKMYFQADKMPICEPNQTNLLFKSEDIDQKDIKSYLIVDNPKAFIKVDKKTCSFTIKDGEAFATKSNFSLFDQADLNGSPIEGGDSGGPVYVCSEIVDKCYLIAINRSHYKGGDNLMRSTQTTLINPFYDEIIK